MCKHLKLFDIMLIVIRDSTETSQLSEINSSEAKYVCNFKIDKL